MRTSFSTTNLLTAKVWEQKIAREAPVEQFWGKFSDSTGNNIVHIKKNLTKAPGDELSFGIRMRNPMKPVVDGKLKGNESRLVTYSDKVTLHSYKVGVADDGALTRKRASFDTVEEMYAKLEDDVKETIEDLMWDAIYASGHTNVLFQNDRANVAALTATDLMTPKLLAKLFTIARTGSHRTFIPLRPIMYKGRPYFILLTHPDVVYDLSQDSTMQQANREAMERGFDNPIFQEADLIYRNVIVFQNEKARIYTNGGGGSVPYCESVLLGAQALMQADGVAPKLVENRDDYDDEIGVGWHMIAGWKRPSYNSKTYGSIRVVTARTNVAVL